ncbi:MAG: transposase [Azonexus sp.]
MCACEHGGGFSLDAGVRIEANDRQGLERLLRYCARPAFAQERLRQIDAEHLVYESPKPGPGGRVSQILIPPPRRHRHRYYGVLAPNSPLRPAVTVLAVVPKPPPAAADAVAEESPVSRAARVVWSMLLARLYEVFPLTCPKCGG